jgi:hypothetical protein
MRSRQVSLLNPFSIKADIVDYETNIQKYLESASCGIAFFCQFVRPFSHILPRLHFRPKTSAQKSRTTPGPTKNAKSVGADVTVDLTVLTSFPDFGD